MSRLLIAMLFAVSALAHAESALGPYEAEYKVKFSIFGGRLTTRLIEEDQGFRATHTLDTTGMSRMIASGAIEEYSRFRADDSGLVPEQFVTSDDITRDKTSANLQFDWREGLVEGEVNNAPFSMSVLPNTQDRVSIQYQLIQDMLRGVQTDQYQMFDIDEIKILEIENIGTRTIKTDIGRFDAVGIRHQSEGSSRTTTFWLVEELGFIPVLIEQHRNGKQRLKATLTRYVALDPPVTSEPG